MLNHPGVAAGGAVGLAGAGAYTLGARALAKMLFRPDGAKAIANGLKMPLGNKAAAGMLASQILKIAGDDATRLPEPELATAQ